MSEAADKTLQTDNQFEEPLRRVNFSPGQLLGVEATRDEQEYHRRRLVRHQYWLHGCGTVVGLPVVLESFLNSEGKPSIRIVVRPGYAIDGLGREVLLEEPYCIDLGAWLQTKWNARNQAVTNGSLSWGDLERDGFEDAGGNKGLLQLKITLRYDQANSGLQPVLATALNASTDPVQPSRLKDCALLELLPEKPPSEPSRNYWLGHPPIPEFADLAGSALTKAEQDEIDLANGTERTRLELKARLINALDGTNQGRSAIKTGADTESERQNLARILLARLSIPVDVGKGEWQFDQTTLNNLDRPFVLSAPWLAQWLA